MAAITAKILIEMVVSISTDTDPVDIRILQENFCDAYDVNPEDIQRFEIVHKEIK